MTSKQEAIKKVSSLTGYSENAVISAAKSIGDLDRASIMLARVSRKGVDIDELKKKSLQLSNEDLIKECHRLAGRHLREMFIFLRYGDS